MNRIARDLGIYDDTMPTHEMISPNMFAGAKEILKVLRTEGFDVIEFWDFAMDDDFTEHPAMAVLASGVLSNPREIA